MVGVPGIASAIFSTVRDAGVNVIMISQASSEHSVCFAVKSSESDSAVKALRLRWVCPCQATGDDDTFVAAGSGLHAISGVRGGGGCGCRHPSQ